MKTNQALLHDQVETLFSRLESTLSADVSRDIGHGRVEKRTVFVTQNLGLVDAIADWVGIKSVICVCSSRWLKGKEEHSKRLYISSLSGCSAKQMGIYIRRHWSIENELHWHLDMTFEEDACQVRKDHAPRNLTTIRKLALGVLRREPSKMSLKRKRKKAARDDVYLKTLLGQLNV